MAIKDLYRVLTSGLLICTLLVATSPLMAADFPPAKGTLGSLIAAGSVQLRGVTVNQEGTLFSGDAISTGINSQARMMLVDGNQVELFAGTKSALTRVDDKLRLTLNSGHVGFKASAKPLTIGLTGFEVLPGIGASGGVAFLGEDYVGIRAIVGSVTVHNASTNKSLIVTSGNVHVLNLKTGQTNVPMTQLASVRTPSLPSSAAPPAAPPRQTGAGGCCTAGQWTAIAIGIGAGTGTALYFVFRDSSPSRP